MWDRLFGGSKRKILIADDDPLVASLVTDVLGTQGYNVRSVGDGQEAVNLLRREKFDLVILDVHMPRLEGPQVLEVIRLMPGGKDQGVIMLTSEGNMSTLIRTCELGIIAYMPKPFSAAKLIEKVNGYFVNKKK
jgi:DNA-binding response OmpR family regulator